MLKLQLTKDAFKTLDGLPPKQFRQIVNKIFKLLEQPHPHDTKQLKGFPFLRNDIGEYRLVYDLKEDTLRLIAVGKRNDKEIYRQL